jgi:chromosome segregation ATPase
VPKPTLRGRRARVDDAEADAKINYQKQLEEMRTQRDEAEAKLKDLREASDNAWDDMKSGFDKAWDSLSNAFTSSMSRFKG